MAELEALAALIEEAARRYDRARTDAGKHDRRSELLALANRAMKTIQTNWSDDGRKRLMRSVEYALGILKREP